MGEPFGPQVLGRGCAFGAVVGEPIRKPDVVVVCVERWVVRAEFYRRLGRVEGWLGFVYVYAVEVCCLFFFYFFRRGGGGRGGREVSLRSQEWMGTKEIIE